MVILTREQVSRCSVKLEGQTAAVAGVEFKKKLYTPGFEFPKADAKNAFLKCRQLLDQGVFCIVIQEMDRFTLWIQQTNSKKHA